jgi:hypothetical protein
MKNTLKNNNNNSIKVINRKSMIYILKKQNKEYSYLLEL